VYSTSHYNTFWVFYIFTSHCLVVDPNNVIWLCPYQLVAVSQLTNLTVDSQLTEPWLYTRLVALLYNLMSDCIENTASNSSSIVACLLVAADMFLSAIT
jgi:hypothetical protein